MQQTRLGLLWAAALMALLGASAGGATLLSRRWPATDAELTALESKLGYCFRGEVCSELGWRS